jgi:excisionase family DNA binding protein
MTDKLLTVQQAASALSLSPHTVRAWLSQRRLACVRLGRCVRIPESEIERLRERGTIPAAQPARFARAR